MLERKLDAILHAQDDQSLDRALELPSTAGAQAPGEGRNTQG